MSTPVALVTGASRGIGLASAVALAREGFAVALNAPPAETPPANAPSAEAPSAEAALEAALEAVRSEGRTAIGAVFDVSDLAAHERQLDAIERELGPLTTLVNNAGVGVLERGDPLDVGTASYDRCQAINARAVFFLTQAFARRLLARERDPALWHSVITVTSSNAAAVAVQRAEYCVSKAAAAMATQAFAVRLGPENIAVYDVRPGLIRTDMTAPVIESYERRAREGLTLYPRVGEPDEVGRIVATLATGRLPYTTGQVIAADAGMLVPRF